MRHRPSFAEFAALAAGASLVPVYRQLVGDTLTPVSAFRKIQLEGPSFLFESVVGGERLGRYSFLGSDPFLGVQAHGTKVRVEEYRRANSSIAIEMDRSDPLGFLEHKLAEYRAPHVPGLPRFCGGAVGYA